MKKNILISAVAGCVMGAGIGLCGTIIAKHCEKKDMAKLEEINETTASNQEANLNARVEYLEEEIRHQNYRDRYFLVCGILLAYSMFALTSKRIDITNKHIQEKHNGLVEHVSDTFIKVGEVCESFEDRISAMEVK